MLLNTFFMLFGLGLVLLGSNLLTEGASSMAKRWGVSDLVVGLTVVAFGTSTPELAISVMSAFEGSAGLAVGNVVGSNIFNILVIIGVTSLCAPIKMERSVLTLDMPLMVLSSVVLLVMGNAHILNHTGTDAIILRSQGMVLLLFFVVYMGYLYRQAKNPANNTDPMAVEGAQTMTGSWLKSIVWVIGGLAALIYGGDRFVDGASGLAAAFGVNEAVIGLTIVAAGTSLPELATSITAAMKGKPGIALGNVIGSNIFNIFMVLGSSATVRQLSFGEIGNDDLFTLLGASLLFWLFGWFFKKRTITRWEGGILLACFFAYTILLINRV